jgi:hypothetical protein
VRTKVEGIVPTRALPQRISPRRERPSGAIKRLSERTGRVKGSAFAIESKLPYAALGGTMQDVRGEALSLRQRLDDLLVRL